jgi:actin-related protein
MIYQSICACDIDVRPNLSNNIILTGATTMLPGFADRVNHELSNMSPGVKKPFFLLYNSFHISILTF